MIFLPIFRAVVRDGETYAYPEDLTDAQVRALWVEGPPGRTTVAVDDDGTLLGSAKMGPNRPGRGAHVGTASFMVGSRARGKGVGRALAEDMVALAPERGLRGDPSVQRRAARDQHPAVRLWQDLGFRILGPSPAAFDSRTRGRVGLHVMLLEL